MRRFFVIVFAAMLFLSSTAFAANWVWVTSNDECTFYIDAPTAFE